MHLFGDNGIISNAQNANVKSGMAALEEWLQEKYVEYYDEVDDYKYYDESTNKYYTNKPELLGDKISNLYLKDNGKNYVTYAGKKYYLINKVNLPDEIKQGLKGGDTTDRLKYIRLEDVYGVTADLKVYYCNDSSETMYGNLEGVSFSSTTPASKINASEGMKQFVSDKLIEYGITVSGETGVTISNAASLKELTIDGSLYDGRYANMTNISGISDLYAIRKLTLRNLNNLDSLEGIESCVNLSFLYLDNCSVKNYSAIPNSWNLEYLYIQIPGSKEPSNRKSQDDCNNEIERLSSSLKDANNLTKLETVGIWGTDYIVNKKFSVDSDSGVEKISNDIVNNLTIINFSEWNDTLKSKIRFLYLNNNNLSSLSGLGSFSRLYELWIFNNLNLNSLSGIENIGSLAYVISQHCNLSDISALGSCSNMYYISVYNNISLSNLNGLEALTKLAKILAYNCSITDISSLNGTSEGGVYLGLSNLTYLDLDSNVNLKNVSPIGKCTKINNLYLANNINMVRNDVKGLESIIVQCGLNKRIPSIYDDVFDKPSIADYTYSADKIYTDTSEKIVNLKNNTNLTWLRLYGQSGLGESRIGAMLKSGYLKFSDLNKIKTNLSELTASQKSMIDYYIGLKETGITSLTDEIIFEKEPNLSDIYIRYILSTCTNLTQISIAKVNNITSLDFMNTVTKLNVLDIRDLGITDLRILNTKGTKLHTVCLRPTSTIHFSDIQTTVNRIKFNSWGVLQVHTLGNGDRVYGSWCLNGDLSLYDFSNCSNITNLAIGGYETCNNTTLDLSGLSTSAVICCQYLNSGKCKLPSNLSNLRVDNFQFYDFSGCESIKSLHVDTSFNFSELTNCKITNIIKEDGQSDLNQVGLLTGSYNTLTSLALNYGASGDWTNLNNFSRLDTVSGEFRNGHCIIINNFNGLSNTCLKYLTFTGYGINNVTDLANCTGLKTIDLSSNNISNSSGLDQLATLTNLTYLNLSGNSIEDMKVFDNFLQNGKTTLTYLNISNNSIDVNGYSSTGTDNMAKIKALQNAGCTVVY